MSLSLQVGISRVQQRACGCPMILGVRLAPVWKNSWRELGIVRLEACRKALGLVLSLIEGARALKTSLKTRGYKYKFRIAKRCGMQKILLNKSDQQINSHRMRGGSRYE